jgi:hypothetical protein
MTLAVIAVLLSAISLGLSVRADWKASQHVRDLRAQQREMFRD